MEHDGIVADKRKKSMSGVFYEDELVTVLCPQCHRVLFKSNFCDGLKLEIKCPNKSCIDEEYRRKTGTTRRKIIGYEIFKK